MTTGSSEYPKNLVFLDFDGVCTCTDDGTYFNPDPKKYHASAEIMQRLKKFCDDNEAKVVVTTNWRKFDPDGTWTNHYGTYKNPLQGLIRQLGSYYFGMLAPHRHVRKSEATILWFEDNPTFNDNFVIFDDDLREGYQTTYDYQICKHFVLVDSKHGLDDKTLAAASEVLS